MATETLTNGIKLQIAHDFLSLRLGNGRTITAGRSGEKASGEEGDDTQRWGLHT